MLTHDQTTLRLRDAEIARLKQENEKLRGKLKDLRVGLAEFIRESASHMSFYHRKQMEQMAGELEAME